MGSATSIRHLAVVALLCWATAACSSEEPQGDLDAGVQSDIDDDAETTNGDSNQPSAICAAGHTRCDGPQRIETCSDDGLQWHTDDCPDGEHCDVDQGACTDRVCQPGAFEECTADGRHRHCNATGTGWTTGDCPDGGECTDGACSIQECQPGVTRCGGRHRLETCSQAGVYTFSDLCSQGTECFDAQCEDLCEISNKISSYIGCEYWSIDLDNYQDALAEPHAIVVTNHSQDRPADIDLYEGRSDRKILNGADGSSLDTTIPPGQARIYQLPVGYGHSGTAKFQDQAIRVTSSLPVVAHQFNPLNNVDVYSNDGSLLLPTNSIGTEYRALGWYNRSDQVQLRGYLTMVNSSTNDTEVRVRPSTQVVAGSDIPAIDAGELRTFQLAPGESLNLVSSDADLDAAHQEGCLADPEGNPDSVTPCPDLTGTHVESDHPITVFGGHQCANVVLGVDRCDHIESVLPPVDTWGTEYVGTKFEPRTESTPVEPDIWRVIAAEDDTHIQTDPAIEGVHGTKLDAGEWKQFAAREDFEIAADKPILAAQYMVGANWSGIPRVCDEGLDAFSPTGIGDPAMTVAVPVEQFRDNYIVHTPEMYLEDYLNVIVPIGEDVELDGEPIPASRWEVLGTMNRYEVATIEVEPGFHTLTADVPFGVVGYGYDCHVSYAYPGGLDLEPLVDGPPVQ